MQNIGKPLKFTEFERMAGELEAMSRDIAARPGANDHLAERLAQFAVQIREDRLHRCSQAGT